jgi:outer membrane immunogenic protein
MKKIILSTLASATLISSNAFANELYIGAGIAQLNFEAEESSVSVDFGDTVTGSIILGANITENFGIEGMLATSITDAEQTFADTLKTEMSINYAAALYAVGKVNISPEFQLYGKLGYIKADFDISLTNLNSGQKVSESGDESDFSYGAGISYAISQTMALRGEYMSYFDKDGLTTDGFGIGLTSTF